MNEIISLMRIVGADNGIGFRECKSIMENATHHDPQWTDKGNCYLLHFRSNGRRYTLRREGESFLCSGVLHTSWYLVQGDIIENGENNADTGEGSRSAEPWPPRFLREGLPHIDG